MGSTDGTYSFNYVTGNVVACIVYMLLVRFYTSNILTSLNNYAMIPVTERLQKELDARQKEVDPRSGGLLDGDSTDSFDSGVDDDKILDEWIFG